MKKKKPARLEFAVVAGELKGRLITTPDLGITRPPLTRLRKAIFDFLTPYLAGARYLDLFSGTGSYLFEAVSRGAGSALGVELEPRLAEAVNRQAKKLSVDDRLLCLGEDVFSAVPRLRSQNRLFDIVMIAPPQYHGLISKTLVCLRDNPVVKPSSLIICQHDTSETKKIDFLDFGIEQRRKYGNTTFTVIRQGEG